MVKDTRDPPAELPSGWFSRHRGDAPPPYPGRATPRIALRDPQMRRILAIARFKQQLRHNLEQAALLAFSAAAIALVSLPDGNPARRWGFVIGLIGQPLWVAATWRARQWGMLLLSLFYFAIWAAGFRTHFL